MRSPEASLPYSSTDPIPPSTTSASIRDQELTAHLNDLNHCYGWYRWSHPWAEGHQNRCSHQDPNWTILKSTPWYVVRTVMHISGVLISIIAKVSLVDCPSSLDLSRSSPSPRTRNGHRFGTRGGIGGRPLVPCSSQAGIIQDCDQVFASVTSCKLLSRVGRSCDGGETLRMSTLLAAIHRKGRCSVTPRSLSTWIG